MDINTLRYILMGSKVRQTGRTTALAEAALKIGAIFIVATEDQKRELKYKYPSLDIRIAMPDATHGLRRSVIIDHLVLEIIAES